MAIRHGFKAQAERLAAMTRLEIGQGCEERLDIPALRAHTGVDLIELGALEHACSDAVSHLHADGLEDFSAGLVVGPAGMLIVINERHAPTRIANSVCHELSHVLLGHEPNPGFDPLGNREWRASDEAEADWLAGCLLAPRDGLIPIVAMRYGQNLVPAAAHYGISVQLMQQRWNQTGCAVQLRRSRRHKP